LQFGLNKLLPYIKALYSPDVLKIYLYILILILKEVIIDTYDCQNNSND
jgi:hypothetical protein